MTTAFHARAAFSQPPEQVWQTLTDWDRVGEWMPGVTDARADGPTEAGMTLVFTTRGKERSSHIAAIEPGRSLVLRSVQGGVTADYTYRLTPDGEGTVVELTADVTSSGAWTLFGPLIRRAIRRADARQLDALGGAVSASSSPS